MDLAHFWNTSGAYQINQSLRFNSADSAYLNRTPASATNRRTWTWSGWVKRSGFSAIQYLFTAEISGTQFTYISFDNDQLRFFSYFGSTVHDLLTSAKYRDPSAWYHVVVAFDSTQSTSSDRAKLYVNGTQITALQIATYPSQNVDMAINNNVEHRIGREGPSNGRYLLDGYLAEVNFIDGTALTPSSFGETDTITGAWIPKKYSGSYGTNGFYLKFESSGIGTDSSGNGNNWTPSGFSTSGTGTDVMSDTPTNNYATINPLFTNYSGGTSDGNLVLGPWSDNGWNRSVGTISQNTGKWYFELTADNALGSGGYTNGIGIAVDPTFISSANLWGSSGTNTSYAALLKSTELIAFSNSTYGSNVTGSFSSGQVMQCAVDIDAGKVWFGTADNWIGGGNPASGTSPTYTFTANSQIYFGGNTYGSGNKTVHNFNQRAFAYTPPTGFKALNTANLPEPTIKKGSKYFDTKLYTGTDASLTVNYDFSPDFVWIKSRSHASDNSLYDIVRGTNLQLRSNSTNAEINDTNGFNSFNSNGFTLGVDTGDNINAASRTYVAWAWDANGAGSSNTAGSITSTVSANASAGFSIVTYTGNATAGATVGHGLGVAPKMIICKRRQNNAAGTSNWQTYHASLGATKLLYLNTTTDALTGDSPWNNTAPTSTVFTLGDNPQGNPNGDNVVAYCFSEVAGYSKFGSYTGNGSSDGVFIHLGFKPAFFMWKVTSTTGSWGILDFKRDTYNVSGKQLFPNQSDAEASYTVCDLLSNGIKMRNTFADTNGSGSTYIFAAFAELPAKYSNAR